MNYRIVPDDHDVGWWRLEVKRWWGWKHLRFCTSHEIAQRMAKHVTSKPEYY